MDCTTLGHVYSLCINSSQISGLLFNDFKLGKVLYNVQQIHCFLYMIILLQKQSTLKMLIKLNQITKCPRLSLTLGANEGKVSSQ